MRRAGRDWNFGRFLKTNFENREFRQFPPSLLSVQSCKIRFQCPTREWEKKRRGNMDRRVSRTPVSLHEVENISSMRGDDVHRWISRLSFFSAFRSPGIWQIPRSTRCVSPWSPLSFLFPLIYWINKDCSSPLLSSPSFFCSSIPPRQI